jgi:hypothetical protein
VDPNGLFGRDSPQSGVVLAFRSANRLCSGEVLLSQNKQTVSPFNGLFGRNDLSVEVSLLAQ